MLKKQQSHKSCKLSIIYRIFCCATSATTAVWQTPPGSSGSGGSGIQYIGDNFTASVISNAQLATSYTTLSSHTYSIESGAKYEITMYFQYIRNSTSTGIFGTQFLVTGISSGSSSQSGGTNALIFGKQQSTITTGNIYYVSISGYIIPNTTSITINLQGYASSSSHRYTIYDYTTTVKKLSN